MDLTTTKNERLKNFKYVFSFSCDLYYRKPDG